MSWLKMELGPPTFTGKVSQVTLNLCNMPLLHSISNFLLPLFPLYFLRLVSISVIFHFDHLRRQDERIPSLLFDCPITWSCLHAVSGDSKNAPTDKHTNNCGGLILAFAAKRMHKTTDVSILVWTPFSFPFLRYERGMKSFSKIITWNAENKQEGYAPVCFLFHSPINTAITLIMVCAYANLALHFAATSEVIERLGRWEGRPLPILYLWKCNLQDIWWHKTEMLPMHVTKKCPSIMKF